MEGSTGYGLLKYQVDGKIVRIIETSEGQMLNEFGEKTKLEIDVASGDFDAYDPEEYLLDIFFNTVGSFDDIVKLTGAFFRIDM